MIEMWRDMLSRNTRIEEKLREKWLEWELEFNDRVAPLIAGEIVSFDRLKPTDDSREEIWGLHVIEYDFFAPGYTAWRYITEEEFDELYRFVERDPDNGREAWFCRFYKHVPWNRVRERIEASGMWDCKELAEGRGWFPG